jgi:hypothetical protein
VEPLEPDRDENVIPSSGIDRSIGYLAIGLAVICFFLLTIFGMSRMERITKASIVDDRPPNRSSAESEIGGVGQ